MKCSLETLYIKDVFLLTEPCLDSWSFGNILLWFVYILHSPQLFASLNLLHNYTPSFPNYTYHLLPLLKRTRDWFGVYYHDMRLISSSYSEATSVSYVSYCFYWLYIDLQYYCLLHPIQHSCLVNFVDLDNNVSELWETVYQTHTTSQLWCLCLETNDQSSNDSPLWFILVHHCGFWSAFECRLDCPHNSTSFSCSSECSGCSVP